MNRAIIISVCCIVSLCCNAQNRGINKICTEDFPRVSFVWNEYGPDIIQNNQVVLRQEERDSPFSWENKVPTVENKNKSILILWEDMYSHVDQSDFTSAMLRDFFANEINANDRFDIAVFNRDKSDDDLLKSITGGFTSDLSLIRMAISSYTYRYETFKKNGLCTNVSLAIAEGLKTLEKEPANNIKVIVVISAGYDMPSKTSFDLACIQACQRQIPIYVVKYPLSKLGYGKDIDGVDESTFGKVIIPGNGRDNKGTADKLYETYIDMAKRHAGQDYEVSFDAIYERDGKPHTVKLIINGTSHDITFVAPEFSLLFLMKENVFMSILFCLFIISILGYFVFLAMKYINNRKKLDNETQKRLEEQQRKQDFLERQNAQMLEEREKEKKQQAFYEEQKRAAAIQQEKENVMRNKNLYARLVCDIDGEKVSFVIQKPLVSIGRAVDNDVVIDKKTVSRKHAEIVFNGDSFSIRNLSTTNRTIVNGDYTDCATLRNGDIIRIGEVMIDFYL